MLNHALENDLQLVPFLVFGFFAGIRPKGELMKLRWPDVQPEASEIVIRTFLRRFTPGMVTLVQAPAETNSTFPQPWHVQMIRPRALLE